MTTDKDPTALEEVKAIRVKNNDLWMRILEVALESNPERTKKIMRKINENDEKITAKFKEMSK
jgi:hypothetical protein